MKTAKLESIVAEQPMIASPFALYLVAPHLLEDSVYNFYAQLMKGSPITTNRFTLSKHIPPLCIPLVTTLHCDNSVYDQKY